jgi:hypothetical protein
MLVSFIWFEGWEVVSKEQWKRESREAYLLDSYRHLD